MTEGKATFAVISWDERTWDGRPLTVNGQPNPDTQGAPLTRVAATYNYQGDVEGSSTIEYLMCYVSPKIGECVSVEHITGKFMGKSGSFTVQHQDRFDAVGVYGTWSVVAGSATGELRGLRAQGQIELVGHRERYDFPFTYEFVEEAHAG